MTGHLQIPWVESPFFESEVAACGASPDRKRWARELSQNGLLVLEDFVDSELIDRLADKTDWLFDPANTFEGLPPEVREVVTRTDDRRQDAWAVCEDLRELACYPPILELLEFLFGRRAFPFQILNFRVGTQQGPHSDAVHFDSLPSRFMCGVWVALEDTTAENGPLFYYPGSHRLPLVRVEELGIFADNQEHAAGEGYTRYERYLTDVLEARGFERQTLCVKRGTTVVWAANVVHGGSPINNVGATRKSQVTHYFFDDCVYYAPILSNPALGEFRLKSVYDLHAHRDVPHSLNGEVLETQLLPNGTHRLGRKGTLGQGSEGPDGLLSRLKRVLGG